MKKIKLKLNNLTKIFGDLVAVDKLSAEIIEGEFVCILGPSGCGKTTTLKMICGLESPTEGQVILDGTVINHWEPKYRNIGLIFQDYAVFSTMTAFENLAFPLMIQKRPKSEIKKKVADIAKVLRVSQTTLNKLGRELSPSEMQRVALGRTMNVNPSIFLLDEPLNMLDADLREIMRGELKRIQKELGKTMIYVTHDQQEAMALGDRVLIIRDGKLQQFDISLNVYYHPANRFVAQFIGFPPMNFIGCLLKASGGEFYVEWESVFKLRVTNIIPHKFKEKGRTSRVTLGIRPEDIEVSPQPVSGEWIKLMVTSYELLGYETVLGVSSRKKENTIIIVAPPDLKFNMGDNVWIKFNKENIHFFSE